MDIMFWICYIALVVIGLFVKQSRIYDCSVIAFMALLAYSNTGAADYSGIYLPVYLDPVGARGIESGWILLCRAGNALGLSYNEFACVVTAVSMCAIRLSANKTVRNTSFFLALFLIYPGLMSLVQFRQFVASAVVALGVLALCRRDSQGTAFFLISVLIGFSIHRSAIIMLVLLLIPLSTKVKRRNWVPLAAIAAGAAILILLNIDLVGSLIFGEFKTSAYLHTIGRDQGNVSGKASLLGGVRSAATLIVFALFVYGCRRECLEQGIELSLTTRTLLDIALVLNGAMLVLIPFVFITNDFMRFQRYVFIPTLAVFSLMPFLPKRRQLLSCKMLYYLICGFFAYEFVVKGTFNSVYLALLSGASIPIT